MAKKVKPKIDAFATFIGRVHYLTYGAIYLLLIPGFSVLFFFMPGHFYHSTVQHERSIKLDEFKIRKIIWNSFKKQFQEEHGDNLKAHNVNCTGSNKSNGVATLRPRDSIIDVINFNIKDGKLTFQIYLPYNCVPNDPKESPIIVTPFPEFYFYIGRTGAQEYFKIDSGNDVVKNVFYGSAYAFPFAMNRLFPPPKAYHNEYPSDVGFLVFKNSDIDEFLAYSLAKEGFPSYSTGSFGRMLYFSAITITTIGFGDIVPISGLSRFFVGLEAILGIILVGLFLNSIVIRIKEQPRK